MTNELIFQILALAYYTGIIIVYMNISRSHDKVFEFNTFQKVIFALFWWVFVGIRGIYRIKDWYNERY